MSASIARRSALVTLAAVAVAGCASISKEECQAIDWRTVGYEHGATGQGAERLSGRRQACARHGVVPDLEAYRIAREEGLLEFCQPANGFRVGTSGRGYGGACPQPLAAAFSEAHDAGRELWRLERQLTDAIKGITARRNEIERIDEVLVSSGLVMVGETRPPKSGRRLC